MTNREAVVMVEPNQKFHDNKLKREVREREERKRNIRRSRERKNQKNFRRIGGKKGGDAHRGVIRR